MKIEKDKRYFGIYLACVICATILTICVVGFLIYLLVKDDVMLWIIFIPILTIIGDLFAFNSFLGYVKTPDVVLEVIDDKIILTPDKKKTRVELLLSDVKGIEIKRPLICRSGKRMIIRTSSEEYFLEDVMNLDESYEELINILKGL